LAQSGAVLAVVAVVANSARILRFTGSRPPETDKVDQIEAKLGASVWRKLI
jgi:hypothetical protein